MVRGVKAPATRVPSLQSRTHGLGFAFTLLVGIGIGTLISHEPSPTLTEEWSDAVRPGDEQPPALAGGPDAVEASRQPQLAADDLWDSPRPSLWTGNVTDFQLTKCARRGRNPTSVAATPCPAGFLALLK
jgi:hypothetical protein